MSLINGILKKIIYFTLKIAAELLLRIWSFHDGCRITL